MTLLVSHRQRLSGSNDWRAENPVAWAFRLFFSLPWKIGLQAIVRNHQQLILTMDLVQ